MPHHGAYRLFEPGAISLNPEIDLKTFQSKSADAANSPRGNMVSPPRRILTRYVLPVLLIGAFIGVFAYASKDALTPVVMVEVIQPVPAAAAGPASSSDVVTSGGSTAATQSPQSTARPAPTFQAPGWVEPDPFTTVVSSLVPGTLSQVYVREGQSVKPGEVMAELDSTDANIAVQKAEATLAVREAELTAAQENWDNPTEIHQAVAVAGAEKTRLEAEKTKMQSQYQFQSHLAQISQQLGKSGADSRLAAEKATMEASVAEATVREIDAQILAQTAVLDGATSTAQLRIADKSRLALARAQLQEARAALQEARVNLGRCKVVASTTATVMRLHKTPGAMVSADVPDGTQILSMYDPESLQVRAEVPLSEAARIQIGLRAEIGVEALPDKIFSAELTRVVHQADVQRNSLQVKLRILDPHPALKPEMVARVQFLAPTAAHMPATKESPVTAALPQTPAPTQPDAPLLIPAELVSGTDNNKANLWLVGPDMRAYQKVIEPGPSSGGPMQAVSGLQLSDKIITSNIEELNIGTRVRIAAGARTKGNRNDD